MEANKKILLTSIAAAIAMISLALGVYINSFDELPPPEPPPSASGNDYFDALAAAPEIVLARSYRSQAEIEADLHGPLPTLHVYDGVRDAARILIGEDTGSDGSIQQIRATLAADINSGTVLATWDFRYDADWRNQLCGVITHKAFMLARDTSGDTRRLEIRSRYSLATAPDVATVDVRPYALGSDTGSGDRLEPYLADFVLAPDKWTRYWALIDFDAKTFSLWLADEDRDAVAVHDATPIPDIDAFNQFWIEFNSSQSRTGPQATVGHFRNLVIQQNTSPIFEKPLP